MSEETPINHTQTKEESRSPSEVLMAAFENVEDMEQVMVIFRLKKDEHGHSGMGWATPFTSLSDKLAFMEEAKLSMYHTVYVCREE
jgi:hypothetical protein